MTENRLKGKRILIVDDEPDVRVTLRELLAVCTISEAGDFETARDFLATKNFDFAILDIMGVDGFQLLQIAKQKKICTVMLTAHALDAQSLSRSFQEGAESYVPKDRIADIATILRGILEAGDEGKRFWGRWIQRLGTGYWDKKLGPDWKARIDADFLRELEKDL